MKRLISREMMIGYAAAAVLGCVALFFGVRWLELAMTFSSRPAGKFSY